jgi:hypothetical protein
MIQLTLDLDTARCVLVALQHRLRVLSGDGRFRRLLEAAARLEKQIQAEERRQVVEAQPQKVAGTPSKGSGV